jgi:hypothetical protein
MLSAAASSHVSAVTCRHRPDQQPTHSPRTWLFLRRIMVGRRRLIRNDPIQDQPAQSFQDAQPYGRVSTAFRQAPTPCCPLRPDPSAGRRPACPGRPHPRLAPPPGGYFLAVTGAERWTGTEPHLGAGMLWDHAATGTCLRWRQAAQLTPIWNGWAVLTAVITRSTLTWRVRPGARRTPHGEPRQRVAPAWQP